MVGDPKGSPTGCPKGTPGLRGAFGVLTRFWGALFHPLSSFIYPITTCCAQDRQSGVQKCPKRVILAPPRVPRLWFSAFKGAKTQACQSKGGVAYLEILSFANGNSRDPERKVSRDPDSWRILEESRATGLLHPVPGPLTRVGNLNGGVQR